MRMVLAALPCAIALLLAACGTVAAPSEPLTQAPTLAAAPATLVVIAPTAAATAGLSTTPTVPQVVTASPASPTPLAPTATATTAASATAVPAATTIPTGTADPLGTPAQTVAEGVPTSTSVPTATVAAASPTVAATPTTASLSGTIKIVSSLPRSGVSARQTQPIVNAIKMCVEDNRNTVLGASIVYEDLDDSNPETGLWDPQRERENADRAAADPDVLIYLGPFNSDAAKVSIPVLNAAGLVMISPANSYPGLTKVGLGAFDEPGVYYPSGVRTYARVVPTDDVQGAAGARWARELGATRVYVLEDGEPFGQVIATTFAATATELGMEVVGQGRIDPKAADYRALATTIQASGVDAIYFGGIAQNNAGQLWRDLRAAMPDVLLMASDGVIEQTFFEEAGPAAEGTYVSFAGLPPEKLTGRGADWYKRYKDRFRAEPEFYAAYGYDACRVALAAIERAASRDRSAVRAAVFATRDYEGVLGRWGFDENGDTTLTRMSGAIIRDGVLWFLQAIEAA